MKLLIFKFRLFVYLGWFSLNLLFNYAQKAKPVFLTVFLFFFISTLVFFYFIQNKIKEQKITNYSLFSPTKLELYAKSEKTKNEIQKEVIFWEKIVEKQPNSRDVLINLSMYKRMLGQNNESEKLWNKALLIDPNNPIFQ